MAGIESRRRAGGGFGSVEKVALLAMAMGSTSAEAKAPRETAFDSVDLPTIAEGHVHTDSIKYKRSKVDFKDLSEIKKQAKQAERTGDTFQALDKYELFADDPAIRHKIGDLLSAAFVAERSYTTQEQLALLRAGTMVWDLAQHDERQTLVLVLEQLEEQAMPITAEVTADNALNQAAAYHLEMDLASYPGVTTADELKKTGHARGVSLAEFYRHNSYVGGEQMFKQQPDYEKVITYYRCLDGYEEKAKSVSKQAVDELVATIRKKMQENPNAQGPDLLEIASGSESTGEVHGITTALTSYGELGRMLTVALDIDALSPQEAKALLIALLDEAKKLQLDDPVIIRYTSGTKKNVNWYESYLRKAANDPILNGS